MLALPPRDEKRRPIHARLGTSEDRSNQPARLLIVEDDYFIALGYESALQHAGYEIVGTAANFEQAVSLAAAERPDLVIMDISLAGPQDGVDAAVVIKDRFGIPTIFASAYVTEANRARAEAAQPLGWISKPIELEQFVAAVEDALDQLKSSSH